jgi:hypothetical protein
MSAKSKQAPAKAAAATVSKKKATEVAESSGDESGSEDSNSLLKSLAAQFALFSTQMSKMEAKLSASLEDNKKLRIELKEKTKIIDDLQSSYAGLEAKLNNMEQYNRSWSVRISGVPLTNEEERNPSLLRAKVHQLVFLPILTGAMEAGELDCIPSACDLLEMVHVLPSKPGTHKPIIARFRDRILRSTCLRLKKLYAPRIKGSSGGNDAASRGRAAAGGVADGGDSGARGGGGGSRFGGEGRFTFPFHEDMTSLNYKKMKAIGADERVVACWSINGQLRYKLHAKPDEIRKVVSVFDPLTTILGPS